MTTTTTSMRSFTIITNTNVRSSSFRGTTPLTLAASQGTAEMFLVVITTTTTSTTM